MSFFLSSDFLLYLSTSPSFLQEGKNSTKTKGFSEQLTESAIYSYLFWTLPVVTGDTKCLEGTVVWKVFLFGRELRLEWLPNSVREDPVALAEVLKKSDFALAAQTESKDFIKYVLWSK